MEDQIEKLNLMIKESKNIVFFGGAGVSTESGIPDFRSANGLYSKKYGTLSPETIISNSFFFQDSELFYKFYTEKLLYPDAKPNKAHLKLAEMEKKGKLAAIITQNIDGLHQLAGSKEVYEIHGTTLDNKCIRCSAKYKTEMIFSGRSLNPEFSKGGYVPYCPKCGGIIKPCVTLYEESLPDDVVEKAIQKIANADMMIIAGTSLNVYPAASFLDFFHGKYLVVINLSDTPKDKKANLVIRGKVGEILSEIQLD